MITKNPWQMLKNHKKISKMYSDSEIDDMTFPELSELIYLYNEVN